MVGPGGAGVSVVAAAAAAQRPAGGRDPRTHVTRTETHTLLITVDRWTPVPDWAGVYRRPGDPVAVSKFLHLLTLDRLDLTERTWSSFVDVLGHTIGTSKVALPGLATLAGIDPAELSSLPGIDDFLLLRRIRDEATSGRWQRIVVDCSGAGDPWQFLRGGSILSQALNRFWPRHRRLAAAGERPALASLTAAVDAIDRDCQDVADLFTDPHSTAVHLVLAADDRTRRLAGHFLAGADLMGLPLASVLINRGVGADSAEALADSVATELARTDPAVAAARRPGRAQVSGTVPVALVERATDRIDRMARLRKLAVSLPEPHGVPRGSAAVEVEETGSTGSVGGPATTRREPTYRLSWMQCLPDPGSLALGRSGDDLLVTISGFRHPVRLPSVLRRCTVVDAAWEGGRLNIGFVPDPAVWPQRSANGPST